MTDYAFCCNKLCSSQKTCFDLLTWLKMLSKWSLNLNDHLNDNIWWNCKMVLYCILFDYWAHEMKQKVNCLKKLWKNISSFVKFRFCSFRSNTAQINSSKIKLNAVLCIFLCHRNWNIPSGGKAFASLKNYIARNRKNAWLSWRYSWLAR